MSEKRGYVESHFEHMHNIHLQTHYTHHSPSIPFFLTRPAAGKRGPRRCSSGTRAGSAGRSCCCSTPAAPGQRRAPFCFLGLWLCVCVCDWVMWGMSMTMRACVDTRISGVGKRIDQPTNTPNKYPPRRCGRGWTARCHARCPWGKSGPGRLPRSCFFGGGLCMNWTVLRTGLSMCKRNK